jgi:hypothetical protein
MSRLLDSSENEQLRSFLESRNLYTPDDPYNVDAGNAVKTINTILNVLNPFSSIDVRNTAVGRALGLTTGQATPLAQIGAIMLANQLAKTAASGTQAAYTPTTTIDPFNRIFEAFKNRIDYQITRREDQSAFGQFFENITRSYRRINPFGPNTTNIQYIRETGKGQLQSLVGNLNRNWYVKSNDDFLNVLGEKDFSINSYSTLIQPRYFFIENSSDQLFNPYNYFKLSFSSNVEMKANDTFSREGSNDRSYAENINEAIKWHGKTTYLDEYYDISLPPHKYGLQDGSKNQIIWGRNGVRSLNGDISPAFNKNANLRGASEEEDDMFPDTLNNYSARRGLLLYTAELLNSTEGKFVDQTRKIFKKSKNGAIEGKQGSGLFIPPSNNYTQAMGSVNGVRQHTAIDQYNRFAKAIRFEGNRVYGGHENSVIYDSVMPKITPYSDAETQEFSPENNPNRNLMFSIENLAFELDDDCTIKTDLYDGEIIQLPKCQKGPNSGRLMWFAPYEIDVVEQAVARYTDTQFIGRGEPLYTYSNSERILTLSFKLLVDHPPQAKNRISDRSVREFFQFGGYEEGNNGEDEFKNLPLLKRREIMLINQINTLESKNQINPIPSLPSSFDFYFPNDIPTNASASSVEKTINDKYEINNQGDSPNWPKNYGNNINFTQNINDLISNYLNKENGSRYIVNIIGWTSDLFTATYNQELGLRRANSLADYIKQKIKEVHSSSVQELGITFNVVSEGEVGDPNTSTAEQIFDLSSVLARRATVLVTLNNNNETNVSNQLSREEGQTIQSKKEELQGVRKQIKTAKGYDKRKSTTCGFNRYKLTNKQHVGYDSFVRDDTQTNQFQPVFYSQDPKDFHDRLTFLHQCTRQGPPVRKKFNDSAGREITVSAKNSVFGRQPICVLRLGDQWNTKVIIENIQFSYSNSPWDTNPEGYGMQFMSADVTMQMKVIGGQSLAGPISVIQNAVTFNYYANSTFGKDINADSRAAYYFEKLQYGTDDSESTGKGINQNSEEVVSKVNTEEINIANRQKQ